jgi:hypothetical protein
MVKLNDVVAGALDRPLAVAQLRTPRPRDRSAVGRSPVPYGGQRGPDVTKRATAADPAATDRDGTREAQPDRETASPERQGATRTESRTRAIARVVARGRAKVRSSAPETVRPDGADRHNRGNTGRFGG